MLVLTHSIKLIGEKNMYQRSYSKGSTFAKVLAILAFLCLIVNLSTYFAEMRHDPSTGFLTFAEFKFPQGTDLSYVLFSIVPYLLFLIFALFFTENSSTGFVLPISFFFVAAKVGFNVWRNCTYEIIAGFVNLIPSIISIVFWLAFGIILLINFDKKRTLVVFSMINMLVSVFSFAMFLLNIDNMNLQLTGPLLTAVSGAGYLSSALFGTAIFVLVLDDRLSY